MRSDALLPGSKRRKLITSFASTSAKDATSSFFLFAKGSSAMLVYETESKYLRFIQAVNENCGGLYVPYTLFQLPKYSCRVR